MTSADAVVTLDVDWAPDPTIDAAARLLIEHDVPATWFVTHASPAVERLRAHPDLFELGIHPNFLPGSSHGDAPEAVLRHCLALVPDAVSMRAHALVQSTPIHDLVLAKTSIRVDVSLLLSGARHLEPVALPRQDRSLLRIPYFWEDDVEMMRRTPTWDVVPLLDGPGLKVFDFHPIHVHLNSADMRRYDDLKATVRPLSHATPTDLGPFVQSGPGTGAAFRALLAALSRGGRATTIRGLYRRWEGLS